MMYKKKQSFISACLGMFIVGNIMISFGTISMYIRSKFILDEMTMGTIPAMLSLGTLFGSVIFGPIVDRYGYKVLTISSVFLIFIGFEIIAFGNNSYQLFISYFLLGLGGGILNGSSSSLVADISTEEKGANLSILHGFFGIGALIMPFAFGILINNLPFEKIFLFFGLVILSTTIFYASVKYPFPKQPHGLPWKKILVLIKDLPLLFFSFFLLFQGGIEAVINNFTVHYAESKVINSQQSLVYLLSFLAMGIIIIRFLIGSIMRKMNFLYALIGGLCIALTGILMIWLFNGYIYYFLGAFLVGIGISPIFPIILGYISEAYPDLSGTAIGVAFLFALAGSASFNLLMGFLSKNFGIQSLPFVISIVILIQLIMVIKISKINKRARKI